MRVSMGTGLLLIVAAVLVIVLSAAWGLELEGYTLTGVAAGGVVGLVPDRSAWTRLGAFVVGFVAAWIGFVLRAAVLPDTTAGVAAGAVVTLLIVVAAVAAGRGRHVPLWAALLGAAAYAGVYESAFAAAPPEVVSTSLDTATSLGLAVAVGFVVACLAAPRAAAEIVAPSPRDGEAADATTTVSEVTL